MMKRLAGALLVTGAGALLILAGARAQSTADQSKEWPTYGHDSGGMRFSPLTELTPENVARLKVAWVYHMRPADFVAPEGGRGGRAGAFTPMNDNPQPAPPGRGRAGAPVAD